MQATHRVKGISGKTLGFMVDGHFYNNYTVRENIEFIENLKVLKNGVVRASKTLPEIEYTKAYNKRVYADIVKKNPFKRDIEMVLKSWKEKDSNFILQVDGARQIGKTTEILKFAYSNYGYVIYVNLVNDDYDFQSCLKAGRVYMELYKYCIRAGLPDFDNSRNTVIVIDEIQESIEVFNSLRTLRAEVSCDIIITGSYLGKLTTTFTKASDKKVFFSMGNIKTVTMLNMSFREFCRAFNKEKELMRISVQGKSNTREYAELEHLYKIYCSIGGYPSVVKKFKETGDINESHKIISELLVLFKRESSRYFSEPKQLAVFDLVYKQAIVEMLVEKRGNGKKLVDDLTGFARKSANGFIARDEVSNALVWLIKCNMISTCSLLNGKDFMTKQPNRRMYFLDCGIATYIMNSLRLEESAKTGLIAETFAFCELNRLFCESISTRKVKDELCFSIYNKYELDFMLVGNGGDIDNIIFGIEIKAGKGSHESLNVYIDRGFVDRGILAETTQGGRGEKFDTIPIYTVGARFPYRQE